MKLTVLICLCFLSFSAVGQSNFYWKGKKHEIRFELMGNVIIIPVKVNGVPLAFLLDTGVKETILFASPQDSVPLSNVHRVKFSGIGIEDGVEGVMAIGNDLVIDDNLRDSIHNLYVIDGDELDISSHIGMPVNGILGSRFFQDFMVQIDYEKTRILLHDPIDYPKKLTRRFRQIPISIERDRPYTEVEIQLDKNRRMPAKMLIDLGNSDGLLLFPFRIDSFTVREPSVYEFIGRGFNGEIFGKRNRIAGLNWAGFQINQPIVSYPDSNAVHAARLAEDRIGSIGNQVMRHFHVLFNYVTEEIYLKPNRSFGKPFQFNMSGMDLKHDGLVWEQLLVPTNISQQPKNDPNAGIEVWQEKSYSYKFQLLPRYVVAGVRRNSPAEIAGVKKGDVLLKLNGRNLRQMKLKGILDKLQHKDGDLIKLHLERDGVPLQLEFRLRDPIPYRT